MVFAAQQFHLIPRNDCEAKVLKSIMIVLDLLICLLCGQEVITFV